MWASKTTFWEKDHQTPGHLEKRPPFAKTSASRISCRESGNDQPTACGVSRGLLQHPIRSSSWFLGCKVTFGRGFGNLHPGFIRTFDSEVDECLVMAAKTRCNRNFPASDRFLTTFCLARGKTGPPGCIYDVRSFITITALRLPTRDEDGVQSRRWCPVEGAVGCSAYACESSFSVQTAKNICHHDDHHHRLKTACTWQPPRA